ncbi:TPA: hypothetical protein ACX6QL_003479 [Photobacterium damselae]
MKKTLLASLLLSTLLVSGVSNAAYTPTDASGSWRSSVRFEGHVTDTKSLWAFESPDRVVQLSWDAKSNLRESNGKKYLGDVAFSQVLLTGVTRSVSGTGHSGLAPAVTIGTDVWDTQSGPSSNTIVIDAHDKSGVKLGSLSMNLERQYASQSASSIVGAAVDVGRCDNSLYSSSVKALELLRSQTYYAENYGSLPSVTSARCQKATKGTMMLDTNASNVSGALHVAASDFKLFFEGAVPGEWAAELPITISMN